PTLEVSVAAGTPEGQVTNTVEIDGGGAPAATIVPNTLTIGATLAPFGFAGANAFYANADGTLDSQAGSHPYGVTVGFTLNNFLNSVGVQYPIGELKDFAVDLPPGIVGNPTVAAHCVRQQFDGEVCPATSQVGTARVGLALEGPTTIIFVFPVFNLVAPPGV